MLICFKNAKIGFPKNILLKQTFLGKMFGQPRHKTMHLFFLAGKNLNCPVNVQFA